MVFSKKGGGYIFFVVVVAGVGFIVVFRGNEGKGLVWGWKCRPEQQQEKGQWHQGRRFRKGRRQC